jgi:hypothetical protein
MNQVEVCFMHERLISAVKMTEFVSDRMSYETKRSLVSYHCYERRIPAEDKFDYVKDFSTRN